MVLRAGIAQAEISGFLHGGSRMYVVVCCGRSFPRGARLRLRWRRENGLVQVEDSIRHVGGYVLWLELCRGLSICGTPLRKSARRS